LTTGAAFTRLFATFFWAYGFPGAFALGDFVVSLRCDFEADCGAAHADPWSTHIARSVITRIFTTLSVLDRAAPANAEAIYRHENTGLRRYFQAVFQVEEGR
jgi:hypothetical protein